MCVPTMLLGKKYLRLAKGPTIADNGETDVERNNNVCHLLTRGDWLSIKPLHCKKGRAGGDTKWKPFNSLTCRPMDNSDPLICQLGGNRNACTKHWFWSPFCHNRMIHLEEYFAIHRLWGESPFNQIVWRQYGQQCFDSMTIVTF